MQTGEYNRCTLCPRACQVDRTAGERGRCHMGDRVVVARAAPHCWEEPPISGQRGSGAVFFSGCPLGCIYCQNREISRGETGREISTQHLAEIFLALAAEGVHNLNLVTGTHFTPSIIEALQSAREKGLTLPVVWNTSGYESPATLSALDGSIDIYLTDLRYAVAASARADCRAPEYPEVAFSALREMVRQTGPCQFDHEGMLIRGTVVRILLLPGRLIEAKMILHRVYETFGNDVYLSLMQQYTPRDDLPAPLDRRVSVGEYRSLVSYAVSLGVTNAFTQEREAASASYIPPFDLTGV